MKLKIILWSAEWCGPCQALKKSKVLEKAMFELLSGLTDAMCTLDVRDVDSKEWEPEAEKQDVQAMPTVDLFKMVTLFDGSTDWVHVHRTVGALTQKQFVTRWKKALL